MTEIPLKIGLAEMLTGGVIMDVVTPEQAKIVQDAGAVAGSLIQSFDGGG
jgi:pyridoxal biosynthesis lyase PdxS